MFHFQFSRNTPALPENTLFPPLHPQKGGEHPPLNGPHVRSSYSVIITKLIHGQ